MTCSVQCFMLIPAEWYPKRKYDPAGANPKAHLTYVVATDTVTSECSPQTPMMAVMLTNAHVNTLPNMSCMINLFGAHVRKWGLRMAHDDASHFPRSDVQCRKGKHPFWRIWHEEKEIRRQLFARKPTAKQEILQSYTRIIPHMAYAPCAWIRRLYARMHAHITPERDVVGTGTWLYAACSADHGAVYWGITGAGAEPGTVMTRFWQEITDA